MAITRTTSIGRRRNGEPHQSNPSANIRSITLSVFVLKLIEPAGREQLCAFSVPTHAVSGPTRITVVTVTRVGLPTQEVVDTVVLTPDEAQRGHCPTNIANRGSGA